MDFEGWIEQHDGMNVLKMQYGLTTDQIKDAFISGLNNLLQTVEIARRLNDLEQSNQK